MTKLLSQAELMMVTAKSYFSFAVGYQSKEIRSSGAHKEGGNYKGLITINLSHLIYFS